MMSQVRDLLVVEHDVGQPDVGGGHVEHVHAPELLWLPHQLVVVPELLHPQVGRHDLVAEVLNSNIS